MAEITREQALAELARRELARRQSPEYQDGAFRASTEGAQSGMMLGFDDEIGGAMMAPIEATKRWMQGDGFDLGQAYRDMRDKEQARKEGRRAAHPIASTVGEIAGGAATAGGLAKSGVTTIGRMGALPGAIVEGGAYGAAYGAGEANPGERMAGALQGGAIGAATGGITQAVGGALANRAARKAMPEAPGVQSLADDASRLYDQARQAGTAINKSAFRKMAGKMRMKAGRLNQNLRPKTAGMVDEITDMMEQPYVDIQDFDELRQTLAGAMRRAEPQDVRSLQSMKQVMDDFADNLTTKDVTGDLRAFDRIKEARGLWSRKKKTEIIEKLLSDADIDTGQYTQSGVANTITRQFRKLAKNEKALRGFSKEERAMIEAIARGDQSPRVLRWLAKFAPRGVVSTILGMGPAMATGPVGLALPAAGFAAGKNVDMAALQAAARARDAVASGVVPQIPRLPMRPYVPLVGGQSSQQIMK